MDFIKFTNKIYKISKKLILIKRVITALNIFSHHKSHIGEGDWEACKNIVQRLITLSSNMVANGVGKAGPC